MFAGHTHQVFPLTDEKPGQEATSVAHCGNAAPLCMAGAEGSHLGRILLTMKQDDKGKWRSFGGMAAVIPAPVPGPHSRMNLQHKRRCDALIRTLSPFLSAPVGRTACALTSYFSHLGDCASTRLVAMAMRDHAQSALADTLFRDIPVLGAASAQRCGGHGGAGNYLDVPAGVLRERDLAGLSPFPNRLHALLTTGAGVKDWLEHAAGVFSIIKPGLGDQQLLRPDVVPYNFDIIEGLIYSIDLTAPPRFDPRGGLVSPDSHRIRDLRYQGVQVDPGAPFILAVSSFRSAGGGFFPGTGPKAAQVLTSPPAMDKVLRSWLTEIGTYYAPAEPLWRFTPVPGASVRFDTAEAALHHLPKAGIELQGPKGDGFITLRMDLTPLALLHDSAYVVA